MFNTTRLDDLYTDPHIDGTKLFLHYGDLTDALSINRVLSEVGPDEVYNLAAQSHVAVSFVQPEYTAVVDAIGPLRILETLRALGLDSTKFYQASTSELFGSSAPPQTEDTKFQPQSPYAIAKHFAHLTVLNYRDAYDMFACSGILFNHESPIRGETFVSRKITRALTRISLGMQDRLFLGNLDARRDWGHARDYVRAQWLMLQQERPTDYVIATGVQHSVRDFVNACAAVLGMEICWEGDGVSEVGRDSHTGAVVIQVDPAYYRPLEVDSLLGDASRARLDLAWTPVSTFEDLVAEMADYDLALARGEHPKVTWQ